MVLLLPLLLLLLLLPLPLSLQSLMLPLHVRALLLAGPLVRMRPPCARLLSGLW
jgi:hypothetical protein